MDLCLLLFAFLKQIWFRLLDSSEILQRGTGSHARRQKGWFHLVAINYRAIINDGKEIDEVGEEQLMDYFS